MWFRMRIEWYYSVLCNNVPHCVFYFFAVIHRATTNRRSPTTHRRHCHHNGRHHDRPTTFQIWTRHSFRYANWEIEYDCEYEKKIENFPRRPNAPWSIIIIKSVVTRLIWLHFIHACCWNNLLHAIMAHIIIKKLFLNLFMQRRLKFVFPTLYIFIAWFIKKCIVWCHYDGAVRFQSVGGFRPTPNIVITCTSDSYSYIFHIIVFWFRFKIRGT